MRIIVLLGAPGAGKGTQGDILADRLGLPRIATGDLFRAAARDGSPVGLEAKTYMERGELVPDGITVRILIARLAAPDAVAGAILDGFPRSGAQAAALDETLAECDARVDVALYIDVPADELFARLSGRWLCQASGHTYHEIAAPPLVRGICDVDGSPLYQRDDDRPVVVRARLEKQLGALADVVDYYAARGVLARVDGSRPIDEVTAGLIGALDAPAAPGA